MNMAFDPYRLVGGDHNDYDLVDADDSTKLRALADWFDKMDARFGVEGDAVQRDLRRIADQLES